MTVGIEATLRESMLDWICNIGTPTRPTDTYYLQWHIADPGAAGTTSISTALPNRDALAGPTPFWEAGASGTDGVVQNAKAGESAAAGGADTISHFSVWSAATLGTFLFSGTVTTPQVVASGGKLTYAIGALTVTLNGAA